MTTSIIIKIWITLSIYPRHNHKNICNKHRRQSNCAENLLSEHPLLLVLQSFEEKIPEWIGRGWIGETLVNLLVIRVRFEPEFVRVQEED